jgi:hypothetical protein
MRDGSPTRSQRDLQSPLIGLKYRMRNKMDFLLSRATVGDEDKSKKIFLKLENEFSQSYYEI